ncbi:hypothetical protein FRC02_000164 [Tulasnella sp. 418]|nr:hypothetical protein FRC02_000164 [Tulasnella sp. 418]
MYQDQESLDVHDFWSGYDDSMPSSPVPNRSSLELRSIIIEPLKVTTVITDVPTISVAPISPISSTSSSISENKQSRQEDNVIIEKHEEDTYWAKYSSVHGTADSTIPSPREQPKTLDASIFEDRDRQIDVDLEKRRDDDYGWHDDEEFRDDEYGRGYDDAFASIRPPSNWASEPPMDDSTLSQTQLDTPQQSDSIASQLACSSRPPDSEPALDMAVMEAIHGVFRLWKSNNGKSKTREEFLNIVRRALDS